MAYTTINKSSDYFNTKLYTGNGSTNNITGVGFQPDFTWIKSRTEGYGHSLFDAVRGVTKAIASEGTGAEYTFSTGLTAFGSDGFTLGSGTVVNNNSQNHASWNWKANGAGSANTDGSISSTVSANATSGFSIVSYTGTGSNATIGHGLGVAPNVVICKSRTTAQGWESYFSALGATQTIRLDSTAAAATSSTRWNNTAPTSTVFSLGTEAAVNGSGANLIAYCFAEKQGFSKFGSYVGNGNADGTFVYTGFKPAMVILKDYTSASAYNWVILDNKRDPSNGIDRRLQPSSALAEYTDVSDFCDFTSNGFKWRGSQANWNGSGVGYIYMAFAEAPLVGTNGVTAKAR